MIVHKNGPGRVNTDMLTDAEREDRIRVLETRRLSVTSDLEKLLALYAKESGRSFFRKRRRTVGLAANDWRPRAGTDGEDKG